MEVAEEGLKEFQEIYKKAYGIELSKEEAQSQSAKFLNLLSSLSEVELQTIEDIRKPYIPSYIKELADLNEHEQPTNTNQ